MLHIVAVEKSKEALYLTMVFWHGKNIILLPMFMS